MQTKFRCKLPGGWYTVQVASEEVEGWCYTKDDTNEIAILTADGSEKELSVTIHELLHACGVKEAEVDHVDSKGRDVADHVARILYQKLGWRQVTEDEAPLLAALRMGEELEVDLEE